MPVSPAGRSNSSDHPVLCPVSRQPILLRKAGDRHDLVLHVLASWRIGWIIDLFLMPFQAMRPPNDLITPYARTSTTTWRGCCSHFWRVFGIHRFYMGKWITGTIWFLTGGLVLVGWLYDLWTLNQQISEENLHYATTDYMAMA